MQQPQASHHTVTSVVSYEGNLYGGTPRANSLKLHSTQSRALSRTGATCLGVHYEHTVLKRAYHHAARHLLEMSTRRRVA